MAQAAQPAVALQFKLVLSGSLDDRGAAIAVDASGNSYVTGSTTSSDFPGLGENDYHGGSDAFVVKLSPSGAAEYTIDLGGVRDDAGTAIALNTGGDAYVAGWTRSSMFPTTPGAVGSRAHGGTCPGDVGATPCSDVFVTEIGPTGNIIASTLLGGSREDTAQGIALDAQGNVYVTGSTDSPDFPVVTPLEAHVHGTTATKDCPFSLPTYPCDDAFVAKLSPDLRSIVYSTYIGGRGIDQGMSIAVDRNREAIITGVTQSPDFPFAHPFQRAIGGPCTLYRGGPRCPDAFVLKLAASGKSLVYSTFLGGKGFDEGHGVASDTRGNAYVVGYTTSPDFKQLHPLQPKHQKGRCTLEDGSHTLCPDMFLTKLDPTGRRIMYSSHFGGLSYDVANAVAVDSAGDAYVAGYAGSYNFPILHAVQSHSGGGFDAAAVEVAPSGRKAVYSTYLGSEGDDYANAVAVDAPGHAVFVGSLSTILYSATSPYRGDDVLVLGIHSAGAKPAALPCRPVPGTTVGGCTH